MSSNEDEQIPDGSVSPADQEKFDRFWQDFQIEAASRDDQNNAVLRDRYLALSPQPRAMLRQVILVLNYASNCLGRLGRGFMYSTICVRLESFKGSGPPTHNFLVTALLLKYLDEWDAEQRELN